MRSNPGFAKFLSFTVLTTLCLSLSGCPAVSVGPCETPDSTATINVAGVYRYSFSNFFNFDVPQVSGTIELEQEGDTVRVVNTTYDSAGNRALEGEGRLDGNVLVIQLTPINGDTDYTTDVRFVFSKGGDEFCVEFSDTNEDVGELGSFIGKRLQTP